MFGEILYDSLGLNLGLIYLSLEFIFVVYYHKRTREVQAFSDPPNHNEMDLMKAKKEFMSCIQLFPQNFNGWFFFSKTSDIYRENAEELLSFLFFSIPVIQLNDYQSKILEDIINELQIHINHKFTPGYNPNVNCMRYCADPVNVLWRPLIFYLGIKFLDKTMQFYLSSRGFRMNYAGQMRYWHRNDRNLRYNKPGRSTTEDLYSQPIVFIHGLGIGLFGFVTMIMSIATGREMYVVELPWVSLQLGESIPQPERFVRCIEFMLTRHAIWKRGACFVSHSYGSCVIGWILKYRPQVVASAVLIEPVAVMLCDFSICYNFLYKTPHKLISMFVRWVVGRELNILTTISRYFIWSENTIYFEDLPQNCGIILTKADHIQNAPVVKKWLEYRMNKSKNDKNLQIAYFEDKIDHAHVLFSENSLAKVNYWINEFDDLQTIDTRKNYYKKNNKRKIKK